MSSPDQDPPSRRNGPRLLALSAAIAALVTIYAIQRTPRPVHPPSELIEAVEFDLETVREEAPGSDNWPMTWAADGHQYTAWGDGGGFGGTDDRGRVSLGVARVEGGPEDYRGFNVWGGYQPEAEATFTGKSVGIIALGDELYMWRGGEGSEADAFEFLELRRSPDRGRSWLPTRFGLRWSGLQAEKRFFAPTFLQQGRDNTRSRDGWVYVYAPDMSDPVWEVQRPGTVTLARVPADGLGDPEAWEYYAGPGPEGAPTWTSTIDDRAPVFTDPENGVMRLSALYNPGLGRYLLVMQQVSRFRERDGHMGIYEAPEPWGPWRTVLFENPWELGLQEGEKTVFWNFSPKWLSPDGRDFVLVYTGSTGDNWATLRGRFRLRPGAAPR